MTDVCVATEDELSERVIVKLISDYAIHCSIAQKFRRGGFGYLKKKLPSFNEIAKNIQPLVILADLDQSDCAPGLIDRWWGNRELSERLIFRVAVRTTEAWVLADRRGFSEFLGINVSTIPRDPEGLDYPKQALLGLAKKSKNRGLRADLLPEKYSLSPVGLNYNSALCEFVQTNWNPERARKSAPSLDRAIQSLGTLQ